jgi:hypothetical protein
LAFGFVGFVSRIVRELRSCWIEQLRGLLEVMKFSKGRWLVRRSFQACTQRRRHVKVGVGVCANYSSRLPSNLKPKISRVRVT